MSDDDVKKSLSDRMGDRFDNPSSTEQDDQNETVDQDETTEPETSSKNAKNAENAMNVKNVKTDWNATSIYLPEFLDRRLTTTYKHADIGYEEEFGQSLQKTRYYYPLVVQLGMERIENMEAQELKECIERLEQEAEQ